MSIKFACSGCKHKIHEDGLIVLSSRPPSCECGRHDFPHSHRGAGMRGREVIPHKCVYCQNRLAFLNEESFTIDGVSFEVPCPACKQEADAKVGPTKAIILFHDCGRPD